MDTVHIGDDDDDDDNNSTLTASPPPFVLSFLIFKGSRQERTSRLLE
jgi:hypothetical protein